ncbi:MAG TPA: hypothetical protein GXX19_08910 [Syntrophomonadaceae bacterium]|nr:hypothetical protein [Syntrophomonadaceae bacterium]
MYSTAHVVKKGDTGIKLVFDIKQPDGSVLDLTNKTANVELRGIHTGTVKRGTCTIEYPPTKGECSYVLTALDTDVPDVYMLRVVIESNGMQVTTTDPAALIVAE